MRLKVSPAAWVSATPAVLPAAAGRLLLLAVCLAAALAFSGAVWGVPSAFADDEAEPAATAADDANIVDPTQRADNSFIYDTTIGSLFDQSSLYDGRTVQVVGEVVGDLINESATSGNRWIMLTATDTDDPSSISVLISVDQAGQIDHFGRYGVTGTTLQVRGTYHQACSEHEGLPDIHATASSVLARGVEHPDKVTNGELVPGALAVLVGVILLAAYYFARERAR